MTPVAPIAMNYNLRGLALQNSEESSTPHRSAFCIGGVSVQIVGARRADVTLDQILERFSAEMSVSDIRMTVEWVSKLLPNQGSQIFDSGSNWRLYGKAPCFQFDFSAPIFGDRPCKRLLVDRFFHSATLQISEEAFPDFTNPPHPFAYPLDELLIMHRLTQEPAIELHGVGIVGPNGANNLFVGHSGAGKSTTARLWTSLHKVEILSDDRIIVREHSAADDKIRIEKSYEGNLPATQIYMYGTPWHGEAHFALPQRAPLKRIFVLEHGHGNVLTRLTRSQMVAELFARAFVPFHRHEYVDHALSFLERVADTVPCYRYSFEPDARAVEKILQLND
jgi:hypothetical protein